MYNNLSLVRILGSINKTVTLAKEVIPIYKRISPIIANSGDFLKKINSFKLNNNVVNNNSNSIKNSIKKEETIVSSEGPTFFL